MNRLVIGVGSMRFLPVVGVSALVSGLRAFVIAGLMRIIQNRRYLNTIGCNRAMFTFSENSL